MSKTVENRFYNIKVVQNYKKRDDWDFKNFFFAKVQIMESE
jgi:hypothetical protein